MAQKTVSLAPGQSTEVAFEVTPTMAKTYKVTVDGLSGSFVAKAAPVGVQVSFISLDKNNILGGQEFTIAITFSNPNDTAVWVRPKFALGQITGSAFTAEKILYGWDPSNHTYDYIPTDWVDLGGYSANLIPEAYGSNMTIYIYDPEGIPMVTGEHAYLKVPAKGQATTSRKWMVASGVSYGVRDVSVKVEDAFYAAYSPNCGIFQGKIVNYKKVGYAPFSGAVNDIVTIGLPPEALTIDDFKLRVNYSGSRFEMEVTMTNNTGKTLISRPSDRIFTRLAIVPYTAETFERLRKINKYDFTEEYTILNPGDPIMSYLLAQKSAGSGSSIGDIPPGTTTRSFSMAYGGGGINPEVIYVGADSYVHLLPLSQAIPEGLEGYVHTDFMQVDQGPMDYIYGGRAEAGFKGIFSSQWQTWTKIPFELQATHHEVAGYEWYTYVFVEL